MTTQPIKHSSAFISFSYASFGLCHRHDVGAGVFFMPIDWLDEGLSRSWAS